MISKELLSEVLGIETTTTSWFIDNSICSYEDGYHYKDIGIYELAHKCKEWALEKTMWIMSYSHSMGGNAKLFRGHLSGRVEIDFFSDTEVESIFKACQWILDNKANNV